MNRADTPPAEPHSAEKRRHPRLPVFTAALITRDGQGWLSEVRDLSQGGVRLARPRRWPGGGEGVYRLYLVFDGDTVIGLDACCVREGEDDLGMAFAPGQGEAIDAMLYESRFSEHDAP